MSHPLLFACFLLFLLPNKLLAVIHAPSSFKVEHQQAVVGKSLAITRLSPAKHKATLKAKQQRQPWFERRGEYRHRQKRKRLNIFSSLALLTLLFGVAALVTGLLGWSVLFWISLGLSLFFLLFLIFLIVLLIVLFSKA